MRALGAICVLVPTAILAIWGGAYVVACLVTLSAGGVPVEYRHRTSAGDLAFRAETYHFDLRRNVLRLDRITAKEPGGQLLASGEALTLMDVIPGRRPIHAVGRDVFLRVERMQDGRFRIQDYIPEEPPTETKQGFSADLRRVSLLYEDRSGKGVFRRWASMTQLRVDGVGSEWAARGPVKIERAGTVHAYARSVPNEGITVRASFPALEISELLRHFASTPEGKDLPELAQISVDSGLVAGVVMLDAPAEGNATTTAQLKGTLRGFAYGRDARADVATFEASAAPEGLRGRVVADSPGSHAVFDGTLRWVDKTVLAGELDARVADKARLPAFLRDSAPRELVFRNGVLDGYLRYEEGAGARVVGNVVADQARWGDEAVGRVAGRIDADDNRLVVAGLDGVWQGTTVAGSVAYEFQAKRVRGHLRAPNASLGPSLRRFGLPIEGTADVRVALVGTPDKPEFVVRANGRGRSVQPGYEADLGRFELGGSFADQRFLIDRFTMAGPSGAATASGIWDNGRQRVDLDVVASSIPLQAFFDEVGGSAAFAGKVSGKPSALQARGQLEVFNGEIGGQVLPFSRGDVVVDRHGLQASRVLAFKKGAQAMGQGGVAFDTQRISGTFQIQGVDLADYAPEGVGGVARVTQGVLSGTLDDPVLDTEVVAQNVAAFGVALDRVESTTRIRGGVVTISSARAFSGSGELTGVGSLELERKTGTFDLTGTSIPIRTLLAELMTDVSVEGLLNGRARGRFENGRVRQLEATGDLANFRVNEAFLGNGPVALNVDGNRWSGSLFLGDISSYLEIPSFAYDADRKTVEGDVVSDNLQASILYDSFKRYLVNEDGQSILPDQLRAQLEDFQGRIDLDSHLTGPLEGLDVDVRSLAVEQMQIGRQNAGRIAARGSRKDEVWTFDQLEWTGGPALMRLNSGRIEEHGQIALDGEIRNLNWKWLAAFFPELARVEGRSDIPFLVQGATQSPEITASLSYEEGWAGARITPWPGLTMDLRNPRMQTRRVDLETIVVKEGSINAEGVFNLEGFTGTLSAHVPFRYPFEIPEGEPINALAQIPNRPLNSLTELLPFLDAARTDGTVNASIQVTGTKSDLLARGSLTAEAKTLGVNNVRNTYEGVSLLAGFENERVSVSASGTSSAGGTFATEDMGFRIDNLEDAFRESFSVLLQNRVFGNIRFNDLTTQYVDPEAGPMSATVSGAVSLAGTLAEPSVEGTLLLTQADLVTPTTYEVAEAPPVFPIDPRFNVSFLTTNNARLRAATGNFELAGSGYLEGSLSAPVFSSNLTVERGNVRLPNARIVLEPGGTVEVTYRSSPTGATVSRVEVDLVGRTQISAMGIAGQVERYDITLNIRGDLLDENGLQLTAQSDPPDLSSDRILAILGQRDVFASRPGESFRADRQLQSALLGLAVPYFASGFMEELAQRLGLDYVNLEYNAFDQFAVSAAITLGRDFVLSGRRQLSNPYPGEAPRYDIRLSYRPPFRNRALRRFTFSIGTDQDRPWKISVEYGIRF